MAHHRAGALVTGVTIGVMMATGLSASSQTPGEPVLGYWTETELVVADADGATVRTFPDFASLSLNNSVLAGEVAGALQTLVNGATRGLLYEFRITGTTGQPAVATVPVPVSIAVVVLALLAFAPRAQGEMAYSEGCARVSVSHRTAAIHSSGVRFVSRAKACRCRN